MTHYPPSTKLRVLIGFAFVVCATSCDNSSIESSKSGLGIEREWITVVPTSQIPELDGCRARVDRVLVKQLDQTNGLPQAFEILIFFTREDGTRFGLSDTTVDGGQVAGIRALKSGMTLDVPRELVKHIGRFPE